MIVSKGDGTYISGVPEITLEELKKLSNKWYGDEPYIDRKILIEGDRYEVVAVLELFVEEVRTQLEFWKNNRHLYPDPAAPVETMPDMSFRAIRMNTIFITDLGVVTIEENQDMTRETLNRKFNFRKNENNQ